MMFASSIFSHWQTDVTVNENTIYYEVLIWSRDLDDARSIYRVSHVDNCHTPIHDVVTDSPGMDRPIRVYVTFENIPLSDKSLREPPSWIDILLDLNFSA